MISEFKGEYRFLSNFWPCQIYYEGMVYQSVEHAYQAAKTTNVYVRRQIADMPKPSMAKRLGKTIPLRDDWENVKFHVMLSLVYYKFAFNKELREKLLATGTEELQEGNTWGDTFWGVCNGVGENKLGKILMLVRGALR
jgi:ribA/ribD-fused uncharacterized protein